MRGRWTVVMKPEGFGIGSLGAETGWSKRRSLELVQRSAAQRSRASVVGSSFGGHLHNSAPTRTAPTASKTRLPSGRDFVAWSTCTRISSLRPPRLHACPVLRSQNAARVRRHLADRPGS